MTDKYGLGRALLFFLSARLTRNMLLLLSPWRTDDPRLNILITSALSLAAVYGATRVMLILVSGLRPFGLKHIGYHADKNTVRRFGLGSILGLISILLLAVIDMASGRASLTIGELSGLHWLAQPIISYFVFFVAALYEEALMRAYLLHVLQDMGRLPALIISSAAFVLLHLQNAGMDILPALNIFLAGMAMGIMVYYAGDIWMPLGFHAAWNFAMGGILGSPVSGLNWPNSIFRLSAAQGFGMEGNVSCTILLLGIFAFFFWKARFNQDGKWKPLAAEIWKAREIEVIIIGEQDE